MIDRQLGITNIPTGVVPQALRDGSEYTELEAEINKLVDIHASEATNWPNVAQLASVILQQQGKDLAAAVWLAAAWVQIKNSYGLAAGVHVLRDMHEHCWDTMLPPVKRIRGRRNLLQWLLDFLEKSLEDTESWQALEPDDYQTLLLDWQFLTEFWDEKDDESPSLFKLKRYFEALATTTVTESADNTTTAADTAVFAEQAEPPDTVPASDNISSSPQPAAKPASVTPMATSPAAVPTADLADTGADTVTLDSASAIEQYIENGLANIQQPLPGVDAELLYLPLMYRFNRQCAWLLIEQLPGASEGITHIPAPSPADQSTLENLLEADDANAILRFCEARLATNRFWLDLNYYAYQAASSQTDGAGAATVILQETMYFLQRLPGLEQLAFANQQPFASPECLAWLATNSNQAVVPEASQTKQVMAKAVNTNNGNVAVVKPANTGDTIKYTTTLAVASAETRAALNLLEVVANRLQQAAADINGS